MVQRVTSWGRLTHDWHHVERFQDGSSALVQHEQHKGLAFGQGRSYGDVCLNPGGLLWDTSALNHFIAFDEATGRLRCEAGVMLMEINRLLIPRGWMLPVTPGTQWVSVGGAIANDVHGKNHHQFGTFADHVVDFNLRRSDGELIHCCREETLNWFTATVGGVGLTGVIVDATLQLRRVHGGWLDVARESFTSLDDFFSLADSHQHQSEHTVAWFDCLRATSPRGIFLRANPSQRNDPLSVKRVVSMPFTPWFSLVNNWTIGCFNHAYYHHQKRCAAHETVDYESFLYPLDSIRHWNRMYGRRGFFQYQCVIPSHVRLEAIQAMLAAISQARGGSFLAVLKTFGARPAAGMLSFVQPGVTLALDFPNRGAVTQALMRRLDAIVLEARGRVYLAKDACMARELFYQGYPRFHEWLAYRDLGIESALFKRLMA